MEVQKNINTNDEIFTAIDFETANRYRNSACALALVRVESGKIVYKNAFLIRPPERYFEFTYIHGITWDMVKNEPEFGELWPEIEPLLEGIDFIAAHNASFDRSVMNACCDDANLKSPDIPYKCTVSLARKQWGLKPARLPDVCSHLDIPLNHHDALSDALACAKIVLAARNNKEFQCRRSI